MKVYKKLLKILKISGLTQQELANRLSVSFATVNSWVNNKSLPRANKLTVIDAMFDSYFLINKNENDLKSLKEYLKKLSKKHKNVLQTLIKNKNLFEEIALELTYNSNKIEGSTLSENETALVMFQNLVVPKKSFIELLEPKNHFVAFKFLMSYLTENKQITEDCILDLHRILMQGILEYPGSYRNHGVRIVGSNVVTANYVKIPFLMNKLVEKINLKTKDVIEQIAEVHAEFERIHPFTDGNGRIGRLIIQAMALKNNLAPSLIKGSERIKYYQVLNLAQIKGDSTKLQEFLIESFFEGFSKFQ